MSDHPLTQARSLDHVVLIVTDAEASVRWYGEVLGLRPERLQEWRQGTVPFVSVRIDDTTIIDLLEGVPSGRNVDHVAIVVDEVDLDALAEHPELEVVMGPMEVFGARGTGQGLYVADPDGHVIELRTYPS